MSVEVATWIEWVRWSARLGTAAFVVAVALPSLTRPWARYTAALWLVFLGAQTLHFGCVVRLGVLVGGANMFPGGRSISDVGGWPTVFGIFALFYACGLPVLWRRSRGEAAGHALRIAALFGTLCVGLMLLATYLPLWRHSTWFALPAALVALALTTELFQAKLRRLGCLAAGS